MRAMAEDALCSAWVAWTDWAVSVSCSTLVICASSPRYWEGSLGLSGSWSLSWVIISCRKAFSPSGLLASVELVDVPAPSVLVVVVVGALYVVPCVPSSDMSLGPHVDERTAAGERGGGGGGLR